MMSKLPHAVKLELARRGDWVLLPGKNPGQPAPVPHREDVGVLVAPHHGVRRAVGEVRAEQVLGVDALRVQGPVRPEGEKWP